MIAPEHKELLLSLSRLAASADADSQWPTQSWIAVEKIGGLHWAIPTNYGGSEADTATMLACYEQLATQCLTSCFILTQRDAACRRILASENKTLCRELLPPLANGEAFATVGLSQLTTSRQHVKPAFTAREVGDCFVFDGSVPWVTGASQAKYIVIGANLEDDRQILCVLPTETSGATIEESLSLLALQGSLTAEIRLRNVRLDKRWLLAGPIEKVMQGKQGGAGGLQTSCLALGLAGAAIAYLKEECHARPGLSSGTERLDSTLQALRREMYRLAQSSAAPEEITKLRARANTLVVQATQAALIASKGSGFVRDHPAQRWVRQAMFFLVWSCPWPAASATMDLLTFSPEIECI